MVRLQLLFVVLLLLVPLTVGGQQRPLPIPLSVERIIELHAKFVPCVPLAQQILENGVSFDATDDTLRKLRAARNPEQQAICDTAIQLIRTKSDEWVAAQGEIIAKHIKTGNSFLDQGDYAKAISEFEQAGKINHPASNNARSALAIARRAQAAETSLSPGPMGYPAIISLLAARVTSSRVSSLIHEKNINFKTLSPADEQKLRQAGAGAEVILAIKDKLPPLPPTPTTLATGPTIEQVQLFNSGRAMIDEKVPKYQEALAQAERALAINSGYDKAWTLKGDALRGLNRLSEALGSYDKAAEINPTDSNNWGKRGLTLQQLSRHEDAVQSLGKALEIDPSFATAWVFLGDSLASLKRCNDARSAYDRALLLNPRLQLILIDRYEALKNCGG